MVSYGGAKSARASKQGSCRFFSGFGLGQSATKAGNFSWRDVALALPPDAVFFPAIVQIPVGAMGLASPTPAVYLAAADVFGHQIADSLGIHVASGAHGAFWYVRWPLSTGVGAQHPGARSCVQVVYEPL